MSMDAKSLLDRRPQGGYWTSYVEEAVSLAEDYPDPNRALLVVLAATLGGVADGLAAKTPQPSPARIKASDVDDATAEVLADARRRSGCPEGRSLVAHVAMMKGDNTLMRETLEWVVRTFATSNAGRGDPLWPAIEVARRTLEGSRD